MEVIETLILDRVERLRPGTSICPGMLAREVGLSPRDLRVYLEGLERKSRIVIQQRGASRRLAEVRGPFRVAPRVLDADEPEAWAEHAGWIGIDYSGAGRPDEPQTGIRVFVARRGGLPEEMKPGTGQRWDRAGLFAWLRRVVDSGVPFVVGIDHALGLPVGWARRHRLRDWDAVLSHVAQRWPADRLPVRTVRDRAPFPPVAEGYRLCDRWAGTAKSLFHFDVPGSVASSTVSGLPWIFRLRKECGQRIHFWPFDGWRPVPGKTVIAEVYPSLWRRRFAPPAGLTADQRDAWTVAAWLQWAGAGNRMARYWEPPLDAVESAQARLEGWILGVG